MNDNPHGVGIRISAILLACAGVASPAYSQAVTGQIDARIELTAACEVNGSTGTSGVSFGTANFGTQTTLFTNATTEVGGSGGSGIAIRCSPGSDAILTVVSGTHDAAAAGGGRAMSNGAQFVPYDLYGDAGFGSVLANGATIPVTADGTVQTVRVYGRAVGATGLTAGLYTDTVSVRLDF